MFGDPHLIAQATYPVRIFEFKFASLVSKDLITRTVFSRFCAFVGDSEVFL